MLSWCVHAVKFKRKIKQPQLTSDNEHNTQIILKTADLSYTHLSTLGGTDFQNKYPLLIYVFNIKCYLSSAFQSTYLSPTFLQQATESRLVVATILPPFFQKLHGLLFFALRQNLCAQINPESWGSNRKNQNAWTNSSTIILLYLSSMYVCVCLTRLVRQAWVGFTQTWTFGNSKIIQ